MSATWTVDAAMGRAPLGRPGALDLGPRRLQIADRQHRNHEREQRQGDLQEAVSATGQRRPPLTPLCGNRSRGSLVPRPCRGNNRAPTNEW